MKTRITNEKIEKVLLGAYPNSKIINISREIINNRTRIIVEYICGICGSKNKSFYDNIKKSRACKQCGIINKKSTKKYTAEYIKKELNKRGFDWTNEDDYVDANSAIKTRCLVCGKVATSNVTSRLINNRGCSRCLGLEKKAIEEVKEEINSINSEYVVTSEDYKSSHSYLTIKHLKCNREFETTRSNFLKGRRCPFCLNYKGEERIRLWLENFGKTFKEQFSFTNCKYKQPLKFDFAIFNNEDIVLVEYNGLQHYEPVEHFGGEKGFKEQVLKDNIKRDFCKKENIKLIEISYKNFNNIDTILQEELRGF